MSSDDTPNASCHACTRPATLIGTDGKPVCSNHATGPERRMAEMMAGLARETTAGTARTGWTDDELSLAMAKDADAYPTTPPVAPAPVVGDGKLYARRDTEDLATHYMRHLDAMTREKLHDKGAIAAELAWRDAELERTRQQSANRLIGLCKCGDERDAAIARAEAAERSLHYALHEGWNCQSNLERTIVQLCDAMGIPHHEHYRLVERLPTAEAAERERDSLASQLATAREALTAIYAWYDRDGSVGGADLAFEDHRAALAPAAAHPK